MTIAATPAVFPIGRISVSNDCPTNSAANNDSRGTAPLPPQPSVVVSGILFSRSVRSSFASFTLAPISLSSTSCLSPNSATKTAGRDHSKQDGRVPLLVRLQFMDNIKELRSYCRKWYKLGDEIEFLCTSKGRWEQSPSITTVEPVGTKQPIDIDIDILQDGNNTSELSPPQEAAKTHWSQQPRWVVDLSSISEAEKSVVVRNSRIWSMKECQQYQTKFLAPKTPQKQKQNQEQQPSAKKKKRISIGIGTNDNISAPSNNNNNNNNHHGGGKVKRLQAQELVDFLVTLIGSKSLVSNGAIDTTTKPTLDQRAKQAARVRDWLNRADGVLDVAGGCGHVAMALGIRGIYGTVVDARSSVGKLPKRDRKIWKRSLRNVPPKNMQDRQEHVLPPPRIPGLVSGYTFCQPVNVQAPKVIPFRSQQAWFGSKPIGYDASFRHPGEEDIPVLVATAAPKNESSSSSSSNHNSKIDNGSNETNRGDPLEDDEEQQRKKQNKHAILPTGSDDSVVLRRRVSALVALHPDEATGEIVEQAVKHRIPFVVVPCCVFARLFPHRKTIDGRPVSSYEDLLDFLQEQDPSIQRTQLSFGGKNIALWSVFPDG